MATSWHKKHISTRVGVVILGVLLIGLAIAIPQLSKNQNLFSRAAVYDYDPRLYQKYPFVDNVDYKIETSGGKIFLDKNSYFFKNKSLTTYSADDKNKKYIYKLKYKGDPDNNVVYNFITFEKENLSVKIKVNEWKYASSTSRGSCTDIVSNGESIVKRSCKYEAQVSTSDHNTRCPGPPGGFLSDPYCGGGSNYRCCAEEIKNSDACAAMNGTCEVVIKDRRYGHYYTKDNICWKQTNSVQCWIPDG